MTSTARATTAPSAPWPAPEHDGHGCAHPAEPLRTRWSGHLRQHGRRVTKQRLAVLDAAHAHPHSTAENLAAIVRQELPGTSVQTVYVVLTDLTGIGLLRKFQPPGTPGLYETRTEDNHHHAFCIRCGRVEDVDCALGEAPCLTPSHTHGLKILSADVVYNGICADCQAIDEAPGTPPAPPSP